MKKLKYFIAGATFGLAISIPTSIFANSVLTKIDAYLRPDFGVTLNGQKLQMKNPPAIINGSMYLPLKQIAQATGLSVHWNDKTQTAELSDGNVNNNQVSQSVNQDINKGDQMVIKAKPESKIPKYGFNDVYQYNGKDYLSVPEIAEKIKGIYIWPNIEKDTLVLSDKVFGGNILIESIPFVEFDLERRIEYDYFIKHILPLSK